MTTFDAPTLAPLLLRPMPALPTAWPLWWSTRSDHSRGPAPGNSGHRRCYRPHCHWRLLKLAPKDSLDEDRRRFRAPKCACRNLIKTRNLKMSRSAHAYVRGNTVRFYEWLEGQKSVSLPEGPPVWVCGDCHVGNLGPVANSAGQIEIQIRDLDQTVIGNPVHDLIRLGLSLACAARGSDLPGITTAKMLERMMDGYERSFEVDFHEERDVRQPESVRLVSKHAAAASWKTLAEERIMDTRPTIPLGKRFWPVSKTETSEIEKLFENEEMRTLATILRSRRDDARVKLLDAAYWMKGCSSLGRLRYAILLRVGTSRGKGSDFCIMDIKEATRAAAPRAARVKMPSDQAERVVEGARHLSPYLGKRMRAVKLMDKAVFVRELLPQDLKIEIEQLSRDEAKQVAYFLAAVVGKGHSRQMDSDTRKQWQKDLRRNRSISLDAPTWLWSSVVDLLAVHERAYLEHCRKYALEVEG
jgi:uncharacterized protein (DUF2252 family)